jgi:ElaB protein
MEPTQNQPQTFKPAGTAAARASEAGQKLADKVDDAAHSVREQVDQAKQKVSEVYDQANKTVSEQYDKALDYSRENPGKTTLIAFGIGVGVGVLLVGNFTGSRSRRRRVVEPVLSAVSTLARELFQ